MPPTQAHDDAALLPALRAGDPHAFETLVRTHMPRMLSVAQKIMRQESDAHDAVQDAFTHAFRALPKFEARSSLATWLHQITVRSCLVILRKRKSRDETSIQSLLPSFLSDGHHAVDIPDWAPSADQIAQNSELKTLIRTKIDELPDSYRIVLLLRDIEGMDTLEAAQLLEISPDALKVRLHRARQALRSLLEPYIGGPKQP